MQAFPTSNANPTACPGWRKNPNTFKSWLILQGIWTSPGSVMLIWPSRCETNIYAPRCSSAAREEPTAVTPCHLPVLEGGMMQELGTSPHAAAADKGPLKIIPLRWGQQRIARVQLSTWGYETSGFSFIPHLTRHNCKWALLLCQHHGIKCVLVREAQTPQNCSLCSRSQGVEAGVSPPVKLMPFYISFVAFCHHHLRSPQDKLQRGKLKRTIQGSDQILQGHVKGFRKRQQSEHRIFIDFTHFLGYL